MPRLPPAAAGRPKERERAALGRLRPAAKAAALPLVQVLRSGTPTQRDGAVRALGRMGPAAREAVPALAEAPRDRETDERLTADTYRTPRCRIGQRVRCLLRGAVVIAGLSEAPVPWPPCRCGRWR